MPIRLLSLTIFSLSMLALPALAQLPPPTPAERAQAAEIAAHNTWKEKTGAYRLCLAQDRVANKYRASLKSRERESLARTDTAPCSDPGPYRYPNTSAESKPLEASESHSPASTSVMPPSTRPNETETKRGQGE